MLNAQWNNGRSAMNESPSAAGAYDAGTLVLRVALGILVLLHGVDKVLHGVSGIEGMLQGLGLPGPLAYGVYLGEVLGPILLIIGWHARVGAGLIVLNMLVAIALAHRQDLLQLNQHGAWALELQGMYLFTAVALVLTGPGRLSVDGR
jgi:putative oxidoreductase